MRRFCIPWEPWFEGEVGFVNYEDEFYVRIYTRDTANWIRLPWQARAILPLIIRKLDRSGVLDGIVDPSADIASIICVPEDIVSVGIDALLSDSRGQATLTLKNHALLMPNYMSGQQARTSDRVRTQGSRERRRAHAGALGSPNTEDSSNLSHAVTLGHTASQAVTLAEHSKAEHSTAEHTEICADVPPTHDAPIVGQPSLFVEQMSSKVVKATKPPKPVKAPRPPKPPPKDFPVVIEAYFEAFAYSRGIKPAMSIRTGKAVKDLLAMMSAERAVCVINTAFEDQWFAEHSGELHFIVANVNKYVRNVGADGLPPLEKAILPKLDDDDFPPEAPPASAEEYDEIAKLQAKYIAERMIRV